MPKVDASLGASLPEGDAYHALRRDWPLLEKLIAEGYTGRKGKGGFYRLNTSDGGRVKEAIDLESGDYAKAERKPALASLDASKAGGLAALLDHEDRGGDFARAVALPLFAYAASLGAGDRRPRDRRRSGACALATTGSKGPSSSSTS